MVEKLLANSSHSMANIVLLSENDTQAITGTINRNLLAQKNVTGSVLNDPYEMTSVSGVSSEAFWHQDNSSADAQADKYGVTERIIIAVILSVIIFFSVAGNMLVCIAVFTDRQLKKTSNFFIVSLATADMLMAMFVMSLATTNDIMGYWPLGGILCNIWISSDVMCSTSSILNLCAISLDRYIHIRSPLHYEQWMTQGRTLLCIAAIWLLSGLISFLPIHLGWHRLDDPDAQNIAHSVSPMDLENITNILAYDSVTNISNSNPGALVVSVSDPYICLLELNPMYAVLSSMISFYIPCVVMILIYTKMFQYAQMHVKAIKKSLAVGSINDGCSAGLEGNPACGKQTQYKLADHKAAVTLGVIMGVFLFCWVPFFTINIIGAFCATCIPPIVFSIFTWLGYLNSTMNPVIYSIFNQEFRMAFKRILSCKPNGRRSRHVDFGYDKPIARTNGTSCAVEYGTTGSSRRTSMTRLMSDKITCV